MSSLWTPAGEHRVPRTPAGEDVVTDNGPGGPPGAVANAGGGAPAGDRPERDPETDRRLVEEMQLLERQLLEAPAADVVANHVYGMLELAALHLSASPSHLDDARLSIDAASAVVSALGERLGTGGKQLREALTSLRMAVVERESSTGPHGAGSAQPG